jgi:hypothetical protein
MSMSMEEVIDREQIRDCLARLARGLDRRDADLVRGAYWPEATDDEGVAVVTLDQMVAWVCPGDPAMRLTMHTMGHSLISVRGVKAVVETHVTSYHRVDTNGVDRDVVLGGRYLDEFEKRKGDWRVLRRKLIYDWCNDLGPSTDFTKGAFGLPLTSEGAMGASSGDYSEKLFRA